MAQIGMVLEGKYEILKEIGHGGMSVVYLAMDIRLNKQWAVKEISKVSNSRNHEIVIQSLLLEANLMKRLDHPALPRIVDIIEDDHTIYVVMDYIEGESLDRILKEYGAQPQELVISWAKQLCDALQYLHTQKPPIIYRDMKPSNVIMKPEGNLKLIDFGIAREYKEEGLADTTILGTRGYAPPEQHGARQTDSRSDIYALGMTMHALVTGSNPQAQDYVYHPVRQLNPALSSGLERIIDKCTALDPKDRYQNCVELLYALEHYEEIDESFRRKQKRKMALFLLAAGLSAVMLAAGVGCRLEAARENRNTYNNLTSVAESTSYQEKIDHYKEAVALYPYKAKAYLCMMEAYEDAGTFSREQNDEFLALYNANRQGFVKNSTEYAQLNEKIGKMYFNYYTREDGTYSFADRVQKAYGFFEEDHENAPPGFADQQVTECYYEICSFYKKYILSSATIEEASKSGYESLLDEIARSLDSLSEESAYDRMAFYNSVIQLLYDQRTGMAQEQVAQDQVQQLLTRVCRLAQETEVRKEQSSQLRDEVLQQYPVYQEAIARAYENREGRT